MEATSIYGDSLVYALREDGALGRYQQHIHVLNPKQVRKFKDAYPDLPKNDYVDAFVIADHLRFGRIASEVYMDDYRYRSLQTLTRARFDAVQNLTREKQRYLFLKCFGFAQDKSISNTSATTLTLMEAFETVDELANTDLETLTAFVAAAGLWLVCAFLTLYSHSGMKSLRFFLFHYLDITPLDYHSTVYHKLYFFASRWFIFPY